MPDLVDFLLEPFRSGIGQRALAEVVLVAAIGGALGFWVLTFGLAYGAESLAHGLLPGLVAAALVGVPLLLGGLAGIAVAALLVWLAGRDERVGTDAATAVAVTGMLGLGGVLALAPDLPPRLGELLFGDPLSARAQDLAAAGGLVVLGGLALAALHRPLAAVAFDREAARSLGLGTGRVTIALLGLVAATLAVAVQGLGNLLVLAVLVAPPVAVRRHASTPARAMLGGGAVAVVAGVAGLYASYHLEIAAGASVALALCLAAGVGAALPPRGRRALARGRLRRAPG
jgi:ABC-type Mn2+/Zn2+ transport system permease subunit